MVETAETAETPAPKRLEQKKKHKKILIMFAILILILMMSISVVLTLIISNQSRNTMIINDSSTVTEQEEKVEKAPEAIVDRNVIDSLLENDLSENKDKEPLSVE